MQTVDIEFRNADEIKEFLSIVDKFDCRATFSSRTDGIDAKSLIGLFSLAPHEVHRLYIQSDNPRYTAMLSSYWAGSRQHKSRIA